MMHGPFAPPSLLSPAESWEAIRAAMQWATIAFWLFVSVGLVEILRWRWRRDRWLRATILDGRPMISQSILLDGTQIGRATRWVEVSRGLTARSFEARLDDGRTVTVHLSDATRWMTRLDGEGATCWSMLWPNQRIAVDGELEDLDRSIEGGPYRDTTRGELHLRARALVDEQTGASRLRRRVWLCATLAAIVVLLAWWQTGSSRRFRALQRDGKVVYGTVLEKGVEVHEDKHGTHQHPWIDAYFSDRHRRDYCSRSAYNRANVGDQVPFTVAGDDWAIGEHEEGIHRSAEVQRTLLVVVGLWGAWMLWYTRPWYRRRKLRIGIFTPGQRWFSQ